MSSAQLEHMAHPPLPPNGGPSAGVITKSSLRYRKRSVCVAVFYLLLLVIPWVVTCVMMFRPVGKPSYNSLAGTQAYKHGEGLDGTTAYTEGDAQDMQRWVQAAHVMNTIATVLALPVLSSLLAQAAVRYTQRQSNGKALNLGQLFSLADRGWADISLVVKTVSSPRTASPLLLFGALLSLVALVQPPIRSILVSYERTSIATCVDNTDVFEARRTSIPTSCRQDNSGIRQPRRWLDPEPGDVVACPRGLVIPKVQHRLADLDTSQTQPFLWTETGRGNGSLFHGYAAPYTDKFLYYWGIAGTSSNAPPLSFYVSALPRGTATGALRYHALRQQSEARCDTVPRSSFPSTCPGDSPFTTSLSQPGMTIRVCSPGAANQSPWKRTRNRQDVSEDLWIDAQFNVTRIDTSPGFTVHCTSNSSLGYFELPSQHNGNTPGPLLDRWPDREDIVSNFHDLTGDSTGGIIPNDTATEANGAEWTGYRTVWDRLPTPGPLTVTGMALFGNTSFFSAIQSATDSNYTDVLRNLCLNRITLPDSIPSLAQGDGRIIGACGILFSPGMTSEDSAEYLVLFMDLLTRFLTSPGAAKAVLETAMFAANEALLTSSAQLFNGLYARQIFSSPGHEIDKPVKSIAAIVVVSVLLFVQAAGVVALAAYNASFPTWTTTLDALAMAKIGRELKDADGLAPLGVLDKHGVRRLAALGHEGVIGVVERDADSEVGDDKAPPVTVLGLGAPGAVTRLTGKPAKSKV